MGCEMVFIDMRLQPVYTVVLDCPGKDSIRLRPLPVVDPWVERRKSYALLTGGRGRRRNGRIQIQISVKKTTKVFIQNSRVRLSSCS